MSSSLSHLAAANFGARGSGPEPITRIFMAERMW